MARIKWKHTKKKRIWTLLWLNTMTKKSYRRKSLLSLRSHRDKSSSQWEVWTGGSWNRVWALMSLSRHRKPEADWKWAWLRILKVHFKWCVSSNKAVLPKPPQTVSPTGDKVFKHLEPMWNILIQTTIFHSLVVIGSWSHHNAKFI